MQSMEKQQRICIRIEHVLFDLFCTCGSKIEIASFLSANYLL